MIRPTLTVRSVRSGWADLRASVLRLERARLRVGVLRGRTPEGRDLVEIAAAHELGTSTIPARSFVAATVAAERREIVVRLASVSAAEIHGAAGLADLADLGQWLARRMRDRILDADLDPPLAPATVARKRREGAEYPEKPLVRTGLMSRSITSEVK